MSADLQQFVREALGRGIPRDAIRAKLLEAGWRPDEIDSSLVAWAEVDFPIPVPRRKPYLSAREAFLYLVLFATLYTSAFNVGQVLFEIIERWLPDPMWRYGAGFSRDAVRNGTAGLIIAFPIFLFVARLIGRAVAREPEKRGSKIRKWLTYITLFVAALVIIGDLTFLVSRLLSGELPPRVLLKALVVFGIAGAVFGYYLGDLQQEEREQGPARFKSQPIIGRISIAIALAVIAAGLFFAGSPGHERQRQLDAQRVDNLRALSASIDAYAREEGKLPLSIDELMTRPEHSRTGALRDPLSGEPYAYRVVDPRHYELCATFATTDSLSEAYPRVPEPDPFWRHGSGRVCFTVRAPASPPSPAPPVQRAP